VELSPKASRVSAQRVLRTLLISLRARNKEAFAEHSNKLETVEVVSQPIAVGQTSYWAEPAVIPD